MTEILHITSGQMGTLLLCLAVGSLIALPTAGYVVGRIGTANTVRAAGLVAAAAGVGVALSLLAASVPGTAMALFFFGIGIGLWDVSQNIEGADVEHQLGRTIMPQFHAAFSGGAFVGALIGAGLSSLGRRAPGAPAGHRRRRRRADHGGPALLPAAHRRPPRPPPGNRSTPRAARPGGTAARC